MAPAFAATSGSFISQKINCSMVLSTSFQDHSEISMAEVRVRGSLITNNLKLASLFSDDCSHTCFP